MICADVRDPGNAGTVIRTADAAGAVGVVLSGNSVDPYNDKTVRASVGSLWHLPISVADDPADCVRRAQAAGFVVLAADGAGDTDLFEAERSGLLDQQVAWLFGNEAWGLPDELAALADHRVSIPIFGRAESLNLVHGRCRLPLRQRAPPDLTSWTRELLSRRARRASAPSSSVAGRPGTCRLVRRPIE